MKRTSTMRRPSNIALVLHLTKETMSHNASIDLMSFVIHLFTVFIFYRTDSTSSSVKRRGWEGPENSRGIYEPQSFKHQMCMIQYENWSSKFAFVTLCCWGHGSVDRVIVKVTHLKFLSTNLGVHTDGFICIRLLHEVHGGRLQHGSTTCWNYEI